MMKTQSILVFVMVFFATLPASTYAGKIPNSYTNENYGFTISFPTGWEIKGSSQKNTLVKAVHKDMHNRIALIAIAAYDIGMDGDIWEVTGEDMFEKSFRADYPNIDATLLDSGKTIINGKHVLWTKIMVKDAWFGPMVSLNYHLVHNKILFRISGSADTDTKWFEENESTFKESISSIDFRTSYQSSNLHIKERGESWLMSILKGWGQVFLLVLATIAVIGIVKYALAKSKKQKQHEDG